MRRPHPEGRTLASWEPLRWCTAETVLARRYRIEITGPVPEAVREELPHLVVRIAGGVTTLIGDIPDTAALYGIIARLEALGVALLSAQPER